MFNLDQGVKTWRNSQPPELLARTELIDELEQHLRDDFDRRTAAGAAPADAWAAAIRHLGASENLAGEFAKLHNRVWLPAWIAAAALTLATVAVGFLAINLRRPLLGAHVLLITTGYGAVFAIGFLAAVAVIARAIGLWSERQQMSFVVAGRRLALVAGITTCLGVALGAWWAHEHLGRWWAWDPKEIGGACVLAWSAVLFQSFRARASTAQSLVLLGVMGNIVVALSWFGPAQFNQTHLYGYPPALFGAVLGGFLISQILLVYIALLPEGSLRPNRFTSAPQG